MATLTIMSGIPGSGKSTIAERLAKENDALIISSDAIREELFHDASIQKEPWRVFEIMKTRTLEGLKAGHNVIYDATNITPKERNFILQAVRDKDIECECNFVHVNCTLANAKLRQFARERLVPFYVIERMDAKYNGPTKEEAYDNVQEVYNSCSNEEIKRLLCVYHEAVEHAVNDVTSAKSPKSVIDGLRLLHDTKKIEKLEPVFPGITAMAQLGNQNTPYHCFTLFEHTLHAMEIVVQDNETFSSDREQQLFFAALCHDFGKPKVKTFDEKTNVCHYFGHADKSVASIRDSVLDENSTLCSVAKLDSDNARQRFLWLIQNHDALTPKLEQLNDAQHLSEFICKKEIDAYVSELIENGINLPKSASKSLINVFTADGERREKLFQQDAFLRSNKMLILETLPYYLHRTILNEAYQAELFQKYEDLIALHIADRSAQAEYIYKNAEGKLYSSTRQTDDKLVNSKSENIQMLSDVLNALPNAFEKLTEQALTIPLPSNFDINIE